MAKMLRRDRARQHFVDALMHNKVHRAIGSRKSKHPDYLTSYWKLVRVLRGFGVPVFLSHNLGEADDAFGRLFTIGGVYHRGSRSKIMLLYRDFPTLAHEFAHAVDDILDGTTGRAERELVASASGYLFTCETLGIHSPNRDVGYAKRQGATPEHYRRLEEYALYVFEEMNTLFGGQK